MLTNKLSLEEELIGFTKKIFLKTRYDSARKKKKLLCDKT